MARSDDRPPPLPGKRRGGLGRALLIGCGGLFVLSFLAFLAVGFLIDGGYLPESQLVRGEDLKGRMERKVRALVLEDGEEVRWFYSGALLDVAEDGNLLTDRRVISYYEDEETDELVVEAVDLRDVTGIRVVFAENWFDDTEVEVFVAGADDVSAALLLLSSLEDLDHEFVRDLAGAARGAGAALDFVELGGEALAADLQGIDGASPLEGR